MSDKILALDRTLKVRELTASIYEKVLVPGLSPIVAVYNITRMALLSTHMVTLKNIILFFGIILFF